MGIRRGYKNDMGVVCGLSERNERRNWAPRKAKKKGETEKMREDDVTLGGSMQRAGLSERNERECASC